MDNIEAGDRVTGGVAAEASPERDLLGAVWSGVLLVDPGTFRVLHANPYAAQALQLPQGDAEGRDARSFFRRWEEPEASVADFSELAEPTEMRIVTSGGQTVPVRVCVKAARERGVVRLVVGFADISRLMAARSSYQLIFENAVEGIFQSSPEGKFIKVNPALARILGYGSPEEVLDSLADLRTQLYVNPTDRDRLFNLLRNHGEVRNLETRFHCRDGSIKWIVQAARAVRDEDGEIKYIEGFNIDITERKLANEAYDEAQARLEYLLTSNPSVIYSAALVEGEPRTTFISDNVYGLVGYRPRDFLDDPDLWDSRVHPEDAGLRQDQLARLDRGGRLTLTYRFRKRSGAYCWLNDECRLIPASDGRPAELVGSLSDVTVRVEAEQNLKKLAEEKEHLRLNLEAFFRSIPDAVITVDKNMRVIQANRAMREICCISGKLQAGRSIKGISGSCERSCFQFLFKTLQTQEPVTEYRVDCLGKADGRSLIINTSPLLDSRHEFMGAVLVIRDITRLATLERQIIGQPGYLNIIGKSRVMQEIYTVLEQLSDVDSTVLVTGESGTGKEIIAEALHYGGPRSSGPMVKVNCSALAESLLESELFGHVRGAFTGAVRDKVGRFQAAERGTIFLDEIGDISPRIQLQLLRFLERKEYERVGDSTTLKANVRVIAATNADLQEKIRLGLFREDLYYRLKVMVMHLPPLRERAEDIPLLCQHFLHQFKLTFGKDVSRLSDEVMRLFMHNSWPGNIRELKSALEHAMILCTGDSIEVEHLPREMTGSALGALGSSAHRGRPDKAKAGTKVGRDALADALARTGGNKAKAARLLGIDRRTLYRTLDRLGPD